MLEIYKKDFQSHHNQDEISIPVLTKENQRNNNETLNKSNLNSIDLTKPTINTNENAELFDETKKVKSHRSGIDYLIKKNDNEILTKNENDISASNIETTSAGSGNFFNSMASNSGSNYSSILPENIPLESLNNLFYN